MSRGSAVRFDNATDGLSRTASLPPIDSCTIGGWYQVIVDTNTYAIFASIGHATTDQYYGLETESDGLQLQLWNGTGAVNGTVLTLGTWYHLMMVVDGTGAGNFRCYLNGVLDITNNGIAALTAAKLCIGLSGDGLPLNGSAASIKIWNVALTQGEIRAEMGSPAPVRRRDLNAWYECQPGRLTLDSSGRGRHMTAGGTLTAEAGPPMLALPRRRIVGKAPAATASLLIPGPRLSQAILAR